MTAADPSPGLTPGFAAPVPAAQSCFRALLEAMSRPGLIQTLTALFAMVWSGVATLILALLIKATIGWRISDDDEVEGIDYVEHGEAGYDLTARAGGSLTGSRPTTVAAATKKEGALA